MHTFSGYIDNNKIVANESISLYEGYNVIITVLDSIREEETEALGAKSLSYREHAARELSGLWASHVEKSVDETVRTFRKGREFDI